MEKIVEKSRNEQHDQFNGLSEKEIHTLYSLATIKKLQPGDILIKPGDIDQTIYLILNGKIRIMEVTEGQAKEAVFLHKGDWFGGLAMKIQRTASVVAAEPSSIMAVNEKTFDAFEEKTQLFFFKRLNAFAIGRICQLEAREKKLTDKNIKLIKDIYRERTKGITDSQNSEMLQNILKKIPKLPVFVTTLANNLLCGRISSGEVAEQIKRDPSLVGIVLKTINSAHYGFQKKISNIQHAIVLLGFNELYQLVISGGVRQSMPDSPSFQELHSHCVDMSHISFALSQETRVGKPVELATIGLMHDLGQIVILLLKKQNPKLAMFIDSLDQSQIGGLLLKSWNLPDVIWKSIEFQFFPEFAYPANIPTEILDNTTILYLSHLCYDIYQNKSEHELHTTFLDEYKQLLNLEKYSIVDIAYKLVLPNLNKKINSLPISLRQLMAEQTKMVSFQEV